MNDENDPNPAVDEGTATPEAGLTDIPDIPENSENSEDSETKEFGPIDQLSDEDQKVRDVASLAYNDLVDSLPPNDRDQFPAWPDLPPDNIKLYIDAARKIVDGAEPTSDFDRFVTMWLQPAGEIKDSATAGE